MSPGALHDKIDELDAALVAERQAHNEAKAQLRSCQERNRAMVAEMEAMGKTIRQLRRGSDTAFIHKPTGKDQEHG